MEKLNELVELAKKATPGKWWIDSHGHSMVAFSGEAGDVEIVFATDNDMGPLVRHGDTGNLSHWRNDNDATFIAAANPDTILAIAEAFRAQEQRAEAAEAKLAELEKQEPVAYVHPAYLQAGALGFDASVGRLAPAQIPLFTRPAPAADLVPIGRVDRGEVSDNNEYPNARVVCLHDQADWENFPDGTELFLRPDPAVCMDKPEPYAWLVHAPQGDYVERNPEVVAHLEGTGLTKCKPLYLDL